MIVESTETQDNWTHVVYSDGEHQSRKTVAAGDELAFKLASLEAWRDIQHAKYGPDWRTSKHDPRPSLDSFKIG